jgi:superoxide dismutase, Fe-Mn family
MAGFPRRHFLFLSSGAVAGNVLASGHCEADESVPHAFDYAASGLVTGKPKQLKHKEIPGFLSAAQIAPHHTAHYGGALKAFVGIEAKFEEKFQNGAMIDPSAFDMMQRTKSSRGNSVLLHELYFDGLAPMAVDPAPNLRQAIEKRFGSLDKWADDFQASARSAAGWAMLVLHPVNARLYNVVSDEHAQGPLWLAMPLIVIDVYEHAFYIDYQNRKADYVDKFMRHIDWAAANARYRSATGG